MNWSWNGGDPYMRGWGIVILGGILVILVGVGLFVRWVTRNDSGRS